MDVEEIGPLERHSGESVGGEVGSGGGLAGDEVSTCGHLSFLSPSASNGDVGGAGNQHSHLSVVGGVLGVHGGLVHSVESVTGGGHAVHCLGSVGNIID